LCVTTIQQAATRYNHPSSRRKDTNIDQNLKRRHQEAMEIKDEETTAEVAMVVQSRFRRVCVFCGSSHGKKKIYQDAAIELGKELVNSFICFFFIRICIFCYVIHLSN
jgi:hypothetical protein